MEPFAAAAIIAVATAGVSLYQGAQAREDAQAESKRLADEQEAARIAATRRELGVVNQKTETALTGAKSRTVNNQPSFAGSTVLGNLPSVNSGQAKGGGTGIGTTGDF